MPAWQIPLLLLTTIFALLFTWQIRQPMALTIGGPDDTPYLTGFHDAETAADTGQRFRWTRGQATITFPGYGATNAELLLRMQGSRPTNSPSVTTTITIGDMSPQTVTVGSAAAEYRFAVPAAAFIDGSLNVTLDTPPYRPPGDQRDLGLVVSFAELHDLGNPGLSILPPLRVVGVAILAVLCAYAAVGIALRSTLAGAVAGWLTAIAFIGLSLGPRMALARFTPALALLISIMTALTLALVALLWWAAKRFAWASSARALGGAALLTGANALILLLGMRHPQYRSSDLMLNVHRLEFVQRGEWVFTLALPGPRALEAPYPPLFYAVMLPFTTIITDKIILVQAVATLFVALGTLCTFALARRIAAADAPALWAAAITSFLPITYNLASAGNFANLFGQGVATIYLTALILSWQTWAKPRTLLLLTLGLTLALLGHFGVFLSLCTTIPLFVLVLLLRSISRRAGLLVLASFLVALALSWAIYYHFHNTLLLGHLRDALSGQTNARGGAVAEASLGSRFRSEGENLLLWWGWPALPLAIAGANLLSRTRTALPTTLALTWLGTAIPFFLAALVAGLSVRFHLFVAPALAVVAGYALWQLWRSHRIIGPLIALIISGLWLWQGLAYWSDRILHAYH